jgi:hypothetical protein
LGPISKILKRKSKGDTETYESFQRHFNGFAPRGSLTVRALFVRLLRSTRIGDSFHLQDESFEAFGAVSETLFSRALSSLFALPGIDRDFIFSSAPASARSAPRASGASGPRSWLAVERRFARNLREAPISLTSQIA